MLPGLNGIAGFTENPAPPPPLPVSLINRGSFTSSTSNLSTYTFSSYGIGTASSTRRVIVAVTGAGGTTPTLSSATIGGISATIHCQTSAAGSLPDCIAAIISATVPTGTTADIVVNFSGTLDNAGVVGIAVDNLLSSTPTNTYTDNTLSTNVLSQSIAYTADGFVIACSTINNTGTTTWAGVTEQWDNVVESNSHSGGDLFPTVSGSGVTVSATDSGVPDAGAMAIAAFR